MTCVAHKNHDEVHGFQTDLRSPCSTGDSKEGWLTPSMSCAAGGYAAAVIGAEDESAAHDHVRNNSEWHFALARTS